MLFKLLIIGFYPHLMILNMPGLLGVTSWNTWVSCEEDNDDNGFCHEVDPNTGYTAQVKNVEVGGRYESISEDPDDPVHEAVFYTTEDKGDGSMVR